MHCFWDLGSFFLWLYHLLWVIYNYFYVHSWLLLRIYFQMLNYWVLQCVFSKKQIPRWKLTCRRLLVSTHGQNLLRGRKKSKVEQREKFGCDRTSTKIQLNPWEALEQRFVLYAGRELGLYISVLPSHCTWACPKSYLTRQMSPADGNIQRGLRAEEHYLVEAGGVSPEGDLSSDHSFYYIESKHMHILRFLIDTTKSFTISQKVFQNMYT